MKFLVLLLAMLSGQWVFAEEVDLGLQSRLSQNRIITGDLVKMQLKVFNGGQQSSSGFNVNIEIMNNAIDSLQTNSPDHCSLSPPNIQCQFDQELSPGAEFILNFRIQLKLSDQLQPLQIMAQVNGNENDPNGSNNFVSQTFTVFPIPTSEEYANALLTNMPEKRRQRFLQAARVLSLYCAGEQMHQRLDGLCDDILQQAELGDFESLTRIMNWMRPRKTVHQAKNANQMATAQMGQLNQRLSQLRAGAQGISFDGLYLRDDEQLLNVSHLSYLANSESSVSKDWRSPWGFFMNGQIQNGDFQYEDEASDQFDFEGNSITMGWDYRFNTKWVLGAGLGYNTFDSRSGDELVMNTKGMSGLVYAMWTPNDAWYLDMKYSHARPDIEQRRAANFTFIEDSLDLIAYGASEITQNTLAMSLGYQWSHKAWQFSPYLSIEHQQAKLKGFEESGAGSFNMQYQGQTFTTERLMAGFNLSRAYSYSSGVFIPQLSYQLTSENQDQKMMGMRLIAMPVDELFEIETDFTDKTYGQMGLGINWVKGNGRMFYLKYNQHMSSQGLNLYSVHMGLRLEF